MTIRVLIADDHKLFRQGLISLMKTRDDLIKIVGEADSGAEAVRLTKLLKPDIILLDIYMPEGSGLEAAREISANYQCTSIIMLTSSEQDEHLQEAVRIGVAGYMLKNLDGEVLFELLEGVQRGEAAMTRSMAARLLKSMSRSRKMLSSAEDLTERELEVLRIVSQGASNSQIAEELNITVNTVKTHLKNILAKLQVDNRTQAAAYALKTGIVSNLEEPVDPVHPSG